MFFSLLSNRITQTVIYVCGAFQMFLAGILSLLTGRKAAIFDAENHLALAWNAMECFVRIANLMLLQILYM